MPAAPQAHFDCTQGQGEDVGKLASNDGPSRLELLPFLGLGLRECQLIENLLRATSACPSLDGIAAIARGQLPTTPLWAPMGPSGAISLMDTGTASPADVASARDSPDLAEISATRSARASRRSSPYREAAGRPPAATRPAAAPGPESLPVRQVDEPLGAAQDLHSWLREPLAQVQIEEGDRVVDVQCDRGNVEAKDLQHQLGLDGGAQLAGPAVNIEPGQDSEENEAERNGPEDWRACLSGRPERASGQRHGVWRGLLLRAGSATVSIASGLALGPKS